MTDRHSALLVTLEEPIREDDLQALIYAIGHLKTVIKVEPVPSDGPMAEMAVRHQTNKEWAEDLNNLLRKRGW